jgi:hypothetical protein
MPPCGKAPIADRPRSPATASGSLEISNVKCLQSISSKFLPQSGKKSLDNYAAARYIFLGFDAARRQTVPDNTQETPDHGRKDART